MQQPDVHRGSDPQAAITIPKQPLGPDVRTGSQ
jgi:hypothetical protein